MGGRERERLSGEDISGSTSISDESEDQRESRGEVVGRWWGCA